MRIFIVTVVLVISIGIKTLNAQTYGCLVGTPSSGTLYIDTDITGIYYINFGRTYSTSPPACPRARLIAASGGCRFTLLGSNTNTRYEYTVVTTTSSPVACDIDHYAYGAVIIAGFLGIRRLRSKV